MKKQELKNCPEWLLHADTVDEDVEVISGRLIWQDGIWEGGVWQDGIWQDGIWRYGTWEDGLWEGGVWQDGTWEDGTWEGGVWQDGTWEGGVWQDGTWEGGVWQYGTWNGGIWEDGLWKGGVWQDGFKSIGQCKWRVFYNSYSGDIKIGCETRSIEEWDRFFSSDEVIETKRGTEEFSMIHDSYRLAKYAIELEQNK